MGAREAVVIECDGVSVVENAGTCEHRGAWCMCDVANRLVRTSIMLVRLLLECCVDGIVVWSKVWITWAEKRWTEKRAAMESSSARKTVS